MNQVLSIFPLLLRAVRPSRTGDMKAVSNAFWLRGGYDALTFFGHIVTHSQPEADRLNSRYDALKNHEMIHLRQAQATGDSWWLFYLRYGWYWLRALPWNRHMRQAAYWLNPFELEAYRHMNDLGYADRCSDGGAQEWRLYARMKYEGRKAVYDKLFREA